MTPRTLRSKISKLDARAPITATFECDLRKLRTWGTTDIWYSTQKEHWLGWLKEYNGPGYYERKDWNRDAEFVYNHIVCPPMVLWLGEASGVPPSLVREAKKAALAAPSSLPAQAASIRRVIPWSLIENRLGVSPLGQRAKRVIPKPSATKVPKTIEPCSLTDYCVYTIVDRKKLDQGFKKQEEGRRWVSADSLFEKSRLTNSRMPVLFGNADNCRKLSHWGLLTDVQVEDSKTIYGVDKLQEIRGRHTPQDLVLRSTGRNIAPNFIRPYAICKTPDFLIEIVRGKPLGALDKSSVNAANAVIDSVFHGISADAQESYLNFLADSIDSISPQHGDRWGTTLFEWGVRLNVGWVECLVLHPDGLNVLLCKESAPTGTKLKGFQYRWAPGCDMATVPLSELTQTLPSLRNSHHEAISIAAGRPTNPTIRKGHSTGITELLSQRLNGKVLTAEGQNDS